MSIHNEKAPGLDGYNRFFFKSTWEITCDEISDAMLDFFQNKIITEEC